MANFKFESKIVNQEVYKEQEQPAQKRPALKERTEVLTGKTYKTHIPNKASYYVTINDFEDGTPFEIFINSKDTEHQQWITALTRVMSAVFRREGNVSFLSKELKTVVDPNGGFWKNGKYVPSIVHEIGSVLEQHLTERVESQVARGKETVLSEDASAGIRGAPCPNCGEHAVIKVEGCEKCTACSWSKCG